jgi:DNA-binding transcriptional ArsR family regulator
MSDIPDSYSLETVDQMRVIADELRQRIQDALAARPMTVTQVGELLGVTPAKIHYHVRELERVGLVRLVDTREKGGILEKYYRSVARYLVVPPSLLHSLSADDEMAAAQGVVNDISRGIMNALSLRGEERTRRALSLGRWYRWMTDEEIGRFIDEVQALLARYEGPRGIEGEEERVVVAGTYNTVPEVEDSAGVPVQPGPRATRRARNIALGSVTYGRADLERAVDRGEALDITVYGHASFAGDVTPDLVERAVARFHHHGSLTASPEVQEVLEQKSDGP